MITEHTNDVVLGRKRHASVYQIYEVLTRPTPWPKATFSMKPEKANAPVDSIVAAVRSPLAYRLNPLVLFPGFVAALMLLADYSQATPVFCTEVGSGCAALRRSSFAHLGPIPTPAVGLFGLAALLVLGLFRGHLARRLHAAVGALSVMAAILLFSVQVSKGQFCQFCLVVDAAALIAGGLGLLRLGNGWDPPARLRSRIVQGLGFAVLASLAAYLVLTKQAPIPVAISEELDRTPKGKVLVLDFLDFECPYCRDAHAGIAAVLEEERDHVRIVRRHVPLSMHPHAEPAARAALCGERFGQAEPMVERLFAMDPKDMTPAALGAAAASLGIEPAAFEQCMQDPGLRTRLDADKAMWKSVGAQGLPTLYVGAHRFVGLVPAADVRAQIEAGK